MDEPTENSLPADREFEDLTMEFLAQQYAAHPVMATAKGVHEYDDGLDSFQRFAIRNDRDQTRAYLHAIDKISLADLSFEVRVDYRVARSSAQMTLAAVEHQRWPETRPDRYLATILSGLSLLIARDYAPLEHRAIGLLGRLQAAPLALIEARSNLIKPPRLFIEAALRQAEIGDILFSDTFPAFAASVKDKPLKNALHEALSPARAAFAEFARSLRETLLPIAENDFMQGKERFDYTLRVGHLMSETSDQIFAIAQEEVARTQRELAAVAEEIEPGIDWKEQLIRLKKLHPKTGDLLSDYQTEIAKAKDFLQYHRLMTLPEAEVLQVSHTPNWAAADSPCVSYAAAAPFEERQEGRLWITSAPKSAAAAQRESVLQNYSRYAIPLHVFSEGYPGRHLQTVRANQTPSRFRRHFAESPLFIEGWAAFSEDIMRENDYFSDPRIHLMRLHRNLTRAVSALLDAQIHTQNLSLADAALFLQETVQMGAEQAVAEVRRFALHPTQGMTPLMGHRALLALQDELRRRQGARFMARRFHDRILAEGSVPPALLHEVLFAVR